MMANKTLIVITGPTASGKTEAAIRAAKKLDTEIISADSRQIYKEMKIGTAVPSPAELAAVPHHFIGELSIHDYYNASMFEQAVLQRLKNLFEKHNTVIMAGGSGLYINAVCHGIDDLPTIDHDLRKSLIAEHEKHGIEYLRRKLKSLDPAYYNKVDLNNAKRLLKAIEISLMTGKPYSQQLTQPRRERPFNIIKTGLLTEREELYQRINIRVDQMIENGLLEEARELHPYKDNNALNTVGYRELFSYFEGDIPMTEAIRLIKRNTRRYARRQMTWFKKDQDIKWFDANTDALPKYIDSIKQPAT